MYTIIYLDKLSLLINLNTYIHACRSSLLKTSHMIFDLLWYLRLTWTTFVKNLHLSCEFCLCRWRRRHVNGRSGWRVGLLSWREAIKASRTTQPSQQRVPSPQNQQSPPAPQSQNSTQKQNCSNKNRKWILQTAAWQEVMTRRLRHLTCTSLVFGPTGNQLQQCCLTVNCSKAPCWARFGQFELFCNLEK